MNNLDWVRQRWPDFKRDKCRTCGDRGWLEGMSFYGPGWVPCYACKNPAKKAIPDGADEPC